MTRRDPYHHPLFWVPDTEFERHDEWSLPKSFCFGDMDILEERNLECIAENYFQCGDLLIQRIYQNDIQDFVAQFPILYLFRHAFEVKLKQIIEVQSGEKAPNEHSLHKLMNQVAGLEAWAKKRLQELGNVDPSSELLRYGGVGSNASDYLGTDLRFFREAMYALRDYLSVFTVAQSERVAS
jgi:hypothetical protein